MVIAIDDNDSMAVFRLFGEPAGRRFLAEEAGLDPRRIDDLSLMGISGVSNMLCAIKFAKYYELTEDDVVATILTDSSSMYQSRIEELRAEKGDYGVTQAVRDFSASLTGVRTDSMLELSYPERKRIHNLKYFTWVEQQGKTAEDLNDQWYHQEKSFIGVQGQADLIDDLIDRFNDMTGLLS
jgi:hypothetical protein